MWGGPGAGNWAGNGDGWNENWGEWPWGDWDESWSGWGGPSPPPGPLGQPQSQPGKTPKVVAPIANIPPIKDVASMVSPRLFAGSENGVTGASDMAQSSQVANGAGGEVRSQSSLDTAALLAYQQMQQQEYGDDGPFGGPPAPPDNIAAEVKELITRHGIRDKKIELRLIEALKHRGDRWVADIQDYRSCLSRARNPAGFLIVKLSDMEKAINAEQGITIGAARELCANYRRGHCNRGDQCKYSHDVQVGLGKVNNVANMIAEAHKSAANLGFSTGGFSSAPAPPGPPALPSPLAPGPSSPPGPPVGAASVPSAAPVPTMPTQEPRRVSRSPPRKVSRSPPRKVSRSPPRRSRSRRPRSRDRGRESRERGRNQRGRDSRDRRRGRDSRSKGRRR